MSRVITFSRTFPAYHPKKGQPTHFVEGILNTLSAIRPGQHYAFDKINPGKEEESSNVFDSILEDVTPFHKSHTIRAGNRWKVGDKFSPRVWSGKPYSSKQITIAPDIEIKKVWNFKIIHGVGYIYNGKNLWNPFGWETMQALAHHDGLSVDDMVDWFRWDYRNFNGQIICWNESINY